MPDTKCLLIFSFHHLYTKTLSKFIIGAEQMLINFSLFHVMTLLKLKTIILKRLLPLKNFKNSTCPSKILKWFYKSKNCWKVPKKFKILSNWFLFSKSEENTQRIPQLGKKFKNSNFLPILKIKLFVKFEKETRKISQSRSKPSIGFEVWKFSKNF